MGFKSTRLIHELHTSPLLIEKTAVISYFGSYSRLISGDFAFSDESEREKIIPAYCLSASTPGRFGIDNAPAKSVAVIEVLAAITKYDSCGDPGTQTLSSLINEAANNPNIAAIVLEVDSPGGTVAGTQTLVKAIEYAREKKPVLSFINEGMMASAAYWIGAATEEIYASQNTDYAGSIGVYQTMVDATKAWEMEGYQVKEVYARQSSEKNREYREFVDKGTTTYTEQEVSKVAAIFISSIKQARGNKINLDAGDPFKGRLYRADEALQIGLIDGIASFDKVVQRAYELADKSPKNSANMSIKLTEKMPWLKSLFSPVPETLSEAHFQLANDKGEKLQADLISTQTKLSEKEKQLEDMLKRAEQAEASAADLQKKLNDYGHLPGAEQVNPKKENEIIDPEKDEISALSHNQEAANNPYIN
jgi:protease-4